MQVSISFHFFLFRIKTISTKKQAENGLFYGLLCFDIIIFTTSSRIRSYFLIPFWTSARPGTHRHALQMPLGRPRQTDPGDTGCSAERHLRGLPGDIRWSFPARMHPNPARLHTNPAWISKADRARRCKIHTRLLPRNFPGETDVLPVKKRMKFCGLLYPSVRAISDTVWSVS